jgi:hypothetical protein
MSANVPRSPPFRDPSCDWLLGNTCSREPLAPFPGTDAQDPRRLWRCLARRMLLMRRPTDPQLLPFLCGRVAPPETPPSWPSTPANAPEHEEPNEKHQDG